MDNLTRLYFYVINDCQNVSFIGDIRDLYELKPIVSLLAKILAEYIWKGYNIRKYNSFKESRGK